MYIAHSPPEKNIKPNYLNDHTESVMKQATLFANNFDPFGLAKVSALMHDQGKKSDSFQEYINSKSKVRGSVLHAVGGMSTLN